MSDIIERLNWRYATKVFNPEKKVHPVTLERAMESLRLSASSFGLQPWKFVLVEDSKLKKELLPHSWNQTQVVDADQLVVFCRPTHFGTSDIDRFISFSARERGVPRESLAGYEQMMKGFLPKMNKEWMEKQIYLALGNFLTSCAVLGLDACPMEGFSAPDYDRILGLEQKGLASVVVCPVGYRDAEKDKYAQLKKLRYPLNELVVKL